MRQPQGTACGVSATGVTVAQGGRRAARPELGMTRLPGTRALRLAATSASLAACAWVAAPASAATITVTETLDVRSADGHCSLREAIDSANNDSAPFGGAGEC